MPKQQKQIQTTKREQLTKVRAQRENRDKILGRDLYPEWYSQKSKSTL